MNRTGSADEDSKAQAAREIVRRLREAGFEAFWAGGCVRDRLLGREPEDYDIAASARPEEVERLFPRTLHIGRAFGVTAVLTGPWQFQVSAFRAEGRYLDGRHPESVTFADARADALRRDFTVNGLFYDPLEERLFDWVGGQEDLRRRLIRAIGEPRERFREDHLRLLRAVRFAAQLDFQIEEKTFLAAREGAPLIRRVSAERIRDELLKLFRPPHAARGLDLLRESGLLREILPEIHVMIGCEQSPAYHPEGDVYEHVRRMLALLPPDASQALVWAVLLHDVGKPPVQRREPDGSIRFWGHEAEGERIARRLLNRLRFPKREIEAIAEAVRRHMVFKDVAQMRPAARRRLLLRPTIELELELYRLDRLSSSRDLAEYERLRGELAELRRQPELTKPLLRGKDLLALGVPEGPSLGRILAEVREGQLAGKVRTREEALDLARRLAAERGFIEPGAMSGKDS